MSEHDRERKEHEERPRVKVTDRRRVRVDEQGGDHHPGRPSRGAQSPTADTALEEKEPETGRAPAEELQDARRQAAEYLDHLQRLKAEFDNYRKRVLKEQTRAVEMASEPLIRRLLEVLDEFDLALMAAEKKPDFEKFLHGVELVYAKLQDILKAEGLRRIEAEGKSFDQEQHEALMQSGEGDGEPVVGDVYRQGYTMKGRVIRPAGVRVVRR